MARFLSRSLLSWLLADSQLNEIKRTLIQCPSCRTSTLHFDDEKLIWICYACNREFNEK